MSLKYFIKRIVSYTPKCFFNFLISLSKNKVVDIDIPNELVNFYPDNGGSSYIEKRNIGIYKYDLQIVVPCYNVEKYIRQCIESIINQKTNYSYVLVLVDDGSTDTTDSILDEYKRDNVIVIHKENGGVSSARNSGLIDIMSEYLMFVDSDDYLLDNDVIQRVLDFKNKHINQNKLTIFEFNHTSDKDKKVRKLKFKKCNYLSFDGFVWGKLIPSKIMEHILFPDKYWFEDTVCSMIMYPQAEECYLCNYCIYYYRKNSSGISLSSLTSNKILDTFYVTRKLIDDRVNKFKLPNDTLFYKRVYLQIICNCVRLLKCPESVQISVFNESKNILNKYNIPMISEFKALYKSFQKNKFKRYIKFCNLYTKIYLNL